MSSKFKMVNKDTDLTSADYYNSHEMQHAKEMADNITEWKKNMAYQISKGKFIFNMDARNIIEAGKPYNPITVLAKSAFNNSKHGAQEWVLMELLEKQKKYIRVGIKYFKIVLPNDDAGKKHAYLKPWDKTTISTQFGSQFLDEIPVYDDFFLKPEHINFQQTIGTMYNLYQPISHRPIEGSWSITKGFLQHVFGEQYELGIEYFQNLYLNPKQLLPVLCLVSEERETGKTTMLNWLSGMFGANYSALTNTELEGNFNSSYASALILGVDELSSNKNDLVEKVKNLATAKNITRTEKHVSDVSTQFYGKIVITSNRADSFLKVEDDEIRFWVRQLSAPKDWVHEIDEKMISEIPAFFNYLTTLELKSPRSRMVFKPTEIRTKALDEVREGSKSAIYKDLREELAQWFNDNENVSAVYASTIDIKRQFFDRNNQYTPKWIKATLKDEFKIFTQKQMRYNDFNRNEKSGTPYIFSRADFVNEVV